MKRNEMKNHTKIYFKHFNYTIADANNIPCEIPMCNKMTVDIHHIDARGMGGDPTGKKDVIGNLMGLCREHHDLYGDKKQYMEYLQEIHNKVLKY